MLREDEQHQVHLGPIYWPWTGGRARQVGGARAALLVKVFSPVTYKVGPEIGHDQLLALCECLDSCREPRCLTLVARMGAQKVSERLPPLVEAMHATGYPVVQLSDPMCGNAIVVSCGNKVRLIHSIAEEVVAFRLAVSDPGGAVAELHSETTLDSVTEHVADSSGLYQVSWHCTSLYDSWLSPRRASSVVMIQAGAGVPSSATFLLKVVA